jgi:FkbM family methyltransferase
MYIAQYLYNEYGLKPENFLVNRKYNPQVGKSIVYEKGVSAPIEEYESFVEKCGNIVMALGVPRNNVPKDVLNNEKINVVDFNFSICVDGNNYLAPDYVRKNGKKLDEVFALLSDRYSQECYINCLKSRISGRSIEMKPAPWVDPPYLLDDLMIWRDKEVFVDCGAYIGDFVDELYAKMPDGAVNDFKVYSFEPDEENFGIMYEKFKNDSHVIPVKKGISSAARTLYFDKSTEEDGHIAESGSQKIEVDSIDNVLGAQKATFIKMDIEGSELDGLKGAKKQIVENKPRLAVCLYHKQNDMFEIPLYIKSLRDDYKFYVRPHSSMPTELVLYAI